MHLYVKVHKIIHEQREDVRSDCLINFDEDLMKRYASTGRKRKRKDVRGEARQHFVVHDFGVRTEAAAV